MALCFRRGSPLIHAWCTPKGSPASPAIRFRGPRGCPPTWCTEPRDWASRSPGAIRWRPPRRSGQVVTWRSRPGHHPSKSSAYLHPHHGGDGRPCPAAGPNVMPTDIGCRASTTARSAKRAIRRVATSTMTWPHSSSTPRRLGVISLADLAAAARFQPDHRVLYLAPTKASGARPAAQRVAAGPARLARHATGRRPPTAMSAVSPATTRRWCSRIRTCPRRPSCRATGPVVLPGWLAVRRRRRGAPLSRGLRGPRRARASAAPPALRSVRCGADLPLFLGDNGSMRLR